MTHAIDRKGLRTWIEIDKKAVEHNIDSLRRILPKGVKFMSVVKSNAYGHTLVEFSLEAEKCNIDYFGVDSLVEAVSLRNAGVKKPILVLGYTLPELLLKAVEYDTEITVSTFELLNEIKKQSFSKKIRVHIKVDTGMHRQGFLIQEAEKLLGIIEELKSQIEVVGLFTHFAAVKNPVFISYTQKQLQTFGSWVKKFRERGLSVTVHAGASGGALVFPEANFNMVRFGIAQYGIWPSKEVGEAAKEKVFLKPILEWKTVIGEIKNLPKGSRIGYDLTEELGRDSIIAVCPIGYWHGYPRSLSGIGWVLVGGRKAKVLGRISMDMTVIDVTEVGKILVGDVVTLIGRDGEETISADILSEMADCSVYELLTRINPLIKRIYL